MDLEDVVTAHRLGLERSPAIGFGRYIVSATSPFCPDDLSELRTDAPRVVSRLFPAFESIYAERGWAMLPAIDRVYVKALARRDLGWNPLYDFGYALEQLRTGHDPRSSLARTIGAKGYHSETTGVYTVR